ncbi:MAG: thioesterase family protein [Spongiibacteraceae bacterium]
MQFSALIASLISNGSHHSVAVSTEWSQGRATFGGLIAALANAAIRREIGTGTPLRGLQITFAGPAHPGQLALHTQILRQGKSVTLARCDIHQDGAVIASVIGSYGLARTPPVHLLPVAIAPERALDDIREVRYVEGISPSFQQYFGHRFAEGGKPGSGAEPRHKVYVRHRDTAPSGEAHLIAIADAVPSPANAAATRPTRGSSLMWTLEVIDHDFDFATDGWWRLDSEVHAAVDGYINETCLVVNPKGRVAAVGHQIVALF